jgi:hypothetical protein
MRREPKPNKLKMRHHSLRRDVAFTDANDHNPIVLEECPRCFGSGKMGVYEYGVEYNGRIVDTHSRVECDVCSGTGTTGEKVSYFDNDAPVIDVTPSADGWLTCPGCGWRFTVRDRNVWSGLRHVRCGQRIRLVGGDA